MFSGIVECTSQLLRFEEGAQTFKLFFQRPLSFDDLQIGDSIAVNGVCLTIETLNPQEIQFSVGHETLQVLQFHPSEWLLKKHNFERSLRLSDRIHGHLVTGHVEACGVILKSEALGDNWLIDIQLPPNLLPFVWKKGSLTLHGVSLTVNEISKGIVSVCLIPETQARTNLVHLEKGSQIYLEPDYMAKAFYHFYTQGVIPPRPEV